MGLIYEIGYWLMPIFPFVFVFSLINAQKYLQESDLKFVVCGLLASVSLLLMIYGLPLWVEIS